MNKYIWLVGVMMLGMVLRGAEVPAKAAATNAAGTPAMAGLLPQDHDYQKVLRTFMATLTEQDFAHGVTNDLTALSAIEDSEVRYRTYIYTLMPQPLVGTKRGVPAINAPAALFTLAAIETTNGVMRAPVYPEALISFVLWDYPGNPYRNSRALKLRAFVAAAVNLMMLDKTGGPGRSDWMGYQLVCSAAPYPGFKDVLLPEVRKAYEDGLKKLGGRLIGWGPRGEEANLDMIVPLGLWYAGQVCNDPAFTREAEAYARKMLADPRYFHPAGYCIERGGLDIGFQGMANYFAVGLALGSDWPFAQEAVERIYRLRAHLLLPEPDGKLTGPTHFNTRTGSDAMKDQWDYAPRDIGAAMITDEAARFVTAPTTDQLAAAAGARAGAFNRQIHENPKGADGKFMPNDAIANTPWKFTMWPSWDFPAAINFACEFYRKGSYAHRLDLEQKNSPFLKSPFLGAGAFVTNFADAFVVSRQKTYAAILHTGPVGAQDPEDGLFQFSGPLGFGGGQLSAFWTPETGSVILGRRRGQHWEQSFDTNEVWRTWPIHAVSGCTAEGKVFTSARILRPEATHSASKAGFTIRVGGLIAGDQLAQTNVLQGTIEYARTFKVGDKGLVIETRVKGDGKDMLAELVETFPVFLYDKNLNTNATVAIEVQSGRKWIPATPEYQDKVTAVKLTRYSGAVLIVFDRPQRVKLSPSDWKDTFLTRAVCRNLMVDLLGSGDKSDPLAGEKAVSYEIRAVAK
ncbi:MAG: hypothetical protein HYV35_10855 [Lentisphaerae bacterium]|nr:hypothetical protein [Lentisphaerota bacterium]